MKYGKNKKTSMGDDDMMAIAKMEKGGIVKMKKGGMVPNKKYIKKTAKELRKK